MVINTGSRRLSLADNASESHELRNFDDSPDDAINLALARAVEIVANCSPQASSSSLSTSNTQPPTSSIPISNIITSTPTLIQSIAAATTTTIITPSSSSSLANCGEIELGNKCGKCQNHDLDVSKRGELFACLFVY